MNNPNSERSIQQTGPMGIGIMFGGKIEAEQIGGVIENNPSDAQDIDEVAQEIHSLLQHLEKSFPTNTTSSQISLVAEAVKRIENQPILKQRIVAALKQGGIKAFEKAIDHPVASFFVGVVEGWTKGT
ncbi:MAG: hypothetical protein RPG89_13335 [Microcystis panniformis WG22]|nr:hypothetical protein [Microcystis panniformis WG22]